MALRAGIRPAGRRDFFVLNRGVQKCWDASDFKRFADESTSLVGCPDLSGQAIVRLERSWRVDFLLGSQSRDMPSLSPFSRPHEYSFCFQAMVASSWSFSDPSVSERSPRNRLTLSMLPV